MKVRIRLIKYQALGNDYFVVEASELKEPLTEDDIRCICNRHYGVGSDGIIIRQPNRSEGIFSIHIYNPDGSWVEKSGNGLRIFARYLWDRTEIGDAPFRVQTPGGTVTCQVLPGGQQVMVDMGQAIFDSVRIPVAGPAREILCESLNVVGEMLTISAVSMGNPHCVVHRDCISEEEARRLGPLVERHVLFPRRTNVQFMEVLDQGNIKLEIWERGAGYTLASGTSSCAASAVAQRLGLCGRRVNVHMPGGNLDVEVSEEDGVILRGPVGRAWEGEIDVEVDKDGLEEGKIGGADLKSDQRRGRGNT